MESAVHITLQANLAHLRSIKDTEHHWLDLFALVTLPTIGYVMTVEDANPVMGWPLMVVLIIYLILLAWMQYVLMRERFSYYSVLRSVVRAQNLLGLFDVRFLSPHFAGSAFPKGFGPYPDQNGTQPQSSFLRRLIYTVLLYFGLVLAIWFRSMAISWSFTLVPFGCFVLDLCWLAYIFCHDQQQLARETAREAGLAGAEPTWFPQPQK
ncbi:MAG: hypothetical protein HY000_35570 [Planctomycetes bacterium]|nr:hypothetical protein [Planctomycetota bacterium]